MYLVRLEVCTGKKNSLYTWLYIKTMFINIGVCYIYYNDIY